mmetsp:Transcript_57457/g.136616  ORF Transcript_57457/g.136616 Transcript_57457/m.136616 type:complete len:141 (+) Transcript_57457:138-560(+)
MVAVTPDASVQLPSLLWVASAIVVMVAAVLVRRQVLMSRKRASSKQLVYMQPQGLFTPAPTRQTTQEVMGFAQFLQGQSYDQESMSPVRFNLHTLLDLQRQVSATSGHGFDVQHMSTTSAKIASPFEDDSRGISPDSLGA